MELQVLGSPYVQAEPAPNIGIFRVMLLRTRVLRLDRREFSLVDPGKNRLKRDRMENPFRPAPGPPIGQRLAKLRDLMGKIHPIGRIATPRSALVEIERTRRW